MSKCFFVSRRGLKVYRTPNVKQLRNAELLGIIRRDEQDATSIEGAQTSSKSFGSQEHEVLPQKASLLADHMTQLPQSPLIARGLPAVRVRHTAPRLLPIRDHSLFQSKLQKSPYAIALATPPRLCVLTSLRLPSYFQIPFGVATHPKTGAPWHLPKLPIQAVSDLDNHENSSVKYEGTQPSALQPDDSSVTPRILIRTLSSTNFLASRQVLAHVSNLKPSKYIKLMPYRWRQDSSVKLPDVVWREDMDTFVLDILRRNVFKILSYLASRPAAYIFPCKSYEDINNHDQVAAVLWLRHDGATSTSDGPSIGAASSFIARQTDPPPYAMHYYRTLYIPCYNLAALVGPTHLRALQESRPDRYSDQFAVIKRKRGTVKVQLEMWKLLGYTARDNKYA